MARPLDPRPTVEKFPASTEQRTAGMFRSTLQAIVALGLTAAVSAVLLLLVWLIVKLAVALF